MPSADKTIESKRKAESEDLPCSKKACGERLQPAEGQSGAPKPEEASSSASDEEAQVGDSPLPRNTVGVIGKSLLYPSLEELGLALPMPLEEAQKAAVFRKQGFLTSRQAAKLIVKFKRLRLQPYTNNSDLDYDADGNAIHCTHYLNDGDRFRQRFCKLRQKVLDLAQEANSVQNWGLDMSNVSVRVAEFHHYKKGGSLPEKDHYDKGSLVTVDVMLQEADGGGEFQTWLGEERFDEHAFHVGDAIAFPSHKYHRVAPISKGERYVMVVEVWSGEERMCGHRCELLAGECDFDADEV